MVHKPPFWVQRYNKKCTYASKASLFLKNNRFYLSKQILCYSLEACLHKSMQRGRFIRRSRIFQNRRMPLEYGLHGANVATGELLSNSLSFCENNCSARQCPKVQKIMHICKINNNVCKKDICIIRKNLYL